MVVGVQAEISLVVVDDHPLVGEGLALALANDDTVGDVRLADSVASALALLDGPPPSLVLADFQLGDGTGCDVVRGVHDRWPGVPVVILTAHPTDAVVNAARAAGCAGLLTKTSTVRQLLASLHVVLSGNSVYPPQAVPGFSGVSSELTRREVEVLGLLAKGLQAADVAVELHVSVHTVRTHIRGILTKLHAHSQLEAVAIARRAGLLPSDS